MWWYRDLTFKIETTIPFSKFWLRNSFNNILPKYIIPNCIETDKNWELEVEINERKIKDLYNTYVFRDYLLWVLNSIDHYWFLSNNSRLINSWNTIDTNIKWNKFNPYEKLKY